MSEPRVIAPCAMTIVSVVYHSGGGHTGALAEAALAGVASVEGVEAQLLRITPEQIQSDGRWKDDRIMDILNRSDAIIFGCPTYMGSVSGMFKLFLEGAFDLWFQQAWKDKLASGLTNSASQNGDKLSTLMQLVVFAAQMGMLWIPLGDPPGNNWSGGSVRDINRLGSFLGVMGQSSADHGPDLAPLPSDRETARRHGRRIAMMAQRWNRTGDYVTEHLREAASLPDAEQGA
jgi:NAD(P)H dehydrogenase (quinone)